MSSIMHLAKLAAAALLGSRLRCSGWRHEVGRLRRTPSHSRRAGARLLALGSDKAGARTTDQSHMPPPPASFGFSPLLNERALPGPELRKGRESRAPDHAPVKATSSRRPIGRP